MPGYLIYFSGIMDKVYKVLDFTTFSRDDLKSTFEHVGRFTAKCGKLGGSK